MIGEIQTCPFCIILQKPEVQNTPPRIYSMEIVSDIRLRYASTKVTSKVVNPASKAQEATFHVVLPDTAFISGFLMYVAYSF